MTRPSVRKENRPENISPSGTRLNDTIFGKTMTPWKSDGIKSEMRSDRMYRVEIRLDEVRLY